MPATTPEIRHLRQQTKSGSALGLDRIARDSGGPEATFSVFGRSLRGRAKGSAAQHRGWTTR
jgi:hypothetical protein